MDEYNKIKAEFKAKNNKEYGETHQCFIRIWWKEYGDVINFPDSYLIWYDVAYNKWKWFEQKQKFVNRHTQKLRKIILSSIWIVWKQIENIIDTKIKLINTNNKCVIVL
jgi:hypothetical protein